MHKATAPLKKREAADRRVSRSPRTFRELPSACSGSSGLGARLRIAGRGSGRTRLWRDPPPALARAS